MIKNVTFCLIHFSLLLVLFASSGPALFAQGSGTTLDSEEQNFLNYINMLRAQNGVAPLTVSPALETAAHWLSADMAAKNYYNETDSLGRAPGTRLAAFGYTSNWGEAIGQGYPDAQSMFVSWLAYCVPGTNCVHAYSQLLLSTSFTTVGIGRGYNAGSQYGWYWTVDLGSGSASTPPQALPVISSFVSSPTTIASGQAATLSWNVSGATSLAIDNGIGAVTGLASRVVTPSATTTYTLTATNSAGNVTSRVTVTVNVLPSAPSITSAVAKSPNEIDLGWTSSSGSLSIAGYQLARNGAVLATLGATTFVYADTTVAGGTTYAYSVRSYDSAGNYSPWSSTLPVTTPAVVPAPVITSFVASPSTISGGQTSTLSWNASNATTITLDNGIGVVTGLTSKVVAPAATTTYTLTATNNQGSVTARATVTVTGNGAPTAPTILSALAKSPTEVDLQWTASSASLGIAGYQITRSGSAAVTVPASTLYFADLVASPNTSYTYFIRSFDSAGNLSAPSAGFPVTTPISTAVSACPSTMVGSFAACFYNNITLTGSPIFTRNDSQISFNWGKGSPDASVQPANFSARWQGTFSFLQGTYTFSATTSDGIRVYVDGAVILDQWRDQSAATFNVPVAITQGNHLVVVEYYEHSGSANVAVSWVKN